MTVQAKRQNIMCPVDITVSFVTATTLVIAAVGLVPLLANRTGLGRVRFTDFLKFDANIGKFVLEAILNFPKIPV